MIKNKGSDFQKHVCIYKYVGGIICFLFLHSLVFVCVTFPPPQDFDKTTLFCSWLYVLLFSCYLVIMYLSLSIPSYLYISFVFPNQTIRPLHRGPLSLDVLVGRDLWEAVYICKMQEVEGKIIMSFGSRKTGIQIHLTALRFEDKQLLCTSLSIYKRNYHKD